MLSPELPKSNHVWKFFRAGGVDQVKIESGADLLALDDLDQKLWVALSCPTRGLEFDSRTLDLIDSDKDGRIRVPEILEAVRWATRSLKNPDELIKGGESLPLDAIAADEAGARLLVAARQVLTNLGKPDATSLTVAEASDTAHIFVHTQFNGDGVISPEFVADPEVKQVVTEIMTLMGGVADRSGIPGVTQATLDQFFKELQAYSDWWKIAEKPTASGTSPILFLGEATAWVWEAVQAVRPKIDDYFARCRIAAFDSRAAGPLNRAEAEFTAIAAKSLAAYSDEVVSFPLARVKPNRPLPLSEGINPAWSKPMERFCREVIAVVFDSSKATLSESEWTALLVQFAPYEAWLTSKQGLTVEKLGLARIEQILASKSCDVIAKLIAQDLAVAPAMAEIANVEKLVRYHRDLFVLLNNFVSFADFYDKDRLAIFQSGRLYMDGRACELCVKVADPAAHSPVAILGKIYLAYCEVRRPAGKEAATPTATMTIAAAFTGGDADRLRVGRNGIYYDRAGKDWDATIVKVLEHPISIHEAFWSPYKRIGRIVSDQIEKFASSREQAVMDKATETIDATAKSALAGKTERPKIDTGTLAAIGIVVTGLVSALSVMVGHLLDFASKNPWWQTPLIFVALMMAISGPSMLIAWMKMRGRDIGPVLDASGWAVNGHIKLNIGLARTLTESALVPGSAIRSIEDLYPDDPPKVPRWFWVLLAIIALLVALDYSETLKFVQIYGWLRGLFIK